MNDPQTLDLADLVRSASPADPEPAPAAGPVATAGPSSTPTLAERLAKCHYIGGIYRMTYDEALVLTSDGAKAKAGGLPQGGFLLAAVLSGDTATPTLADGELILLRVTGTEVLPNDRSLTETRAEVVKRSDNQSKGYDDVADALTKQELSQSAFGCQVLGTFYLDGGQVRFGADVDNVYASVVYRVYLPDAETLSWIASFSVGDPDEDSMSLPLGVVRYTSTRHRARAAGIDAAPVNVQVSDFIGAKTALLGTTRSGKSNSVKTLTTAVMKYSLAKQRPIGQLIFDPQGEYANPNSQDGTALKLLGGPDHVRVYRMGAKNHDPQVRPLGMDFYDPANLEATSALVNSMLSSSEYGSYAYIQSFTSIAWGAPDQADHRAVANWSRAVIGFYGLLHSCGFRGAQFADSKGIRFTWSADDYNEFVSEEPERAALVVKPASGSTYLARSPEAAAEITFFMKKQETWAKNKTGADTPFKFICDVLDRSAAKAVLRTMTDFHSTSATERVENQVWDDMSNGRIAIVDLSWGSDEVAKAISSRIVTELLVRASDRFRSGQSEVEMQIVVEEAHNLFERGAKDVAGNPWVRLSKEAAKYKMGLVYATQEVTSVDQRILSNTANWVISHLNSHRELNELGNYYDYRVFAGALLRSEDKGFVRMKTRSAPYIVPVQVAKFDAEMVNEVRRLVGLDDWHPGA